MGQSNSSQRELEKRGPFNEPVARFDEFGRITNFYYDDFNRFRPGRNPNPRRAYWKKGELIGLHFHILSIFRIIHWKIISLIWGWRWRAHILMLDKIWMLRSRKLEIHFNAGW